MRKENLFMRGLALLLCFATLVGFVPAGIFAGLQVNAVEVATAPVNMVQNGTFDTDAESWTLINAAQSTVEVADGVVSIVSETVRDENGDVVVDADGNKLNKTAVTLKQTFEAAQLQKYTLKFRYQYVSGNAAHPYIGLWFFKGKNTNDNHLGTVKATLSDKAGEWVEVTVETIAPAGADIVEIQIGTNSGANAAFKVDDVTLTAGSEKYLLSENFENFNVGANGKPYAALGAVGWTDSDPANGTPVGIYSNYYQGSNSLFFQADNTWAQSPAFEVKAGYAYTVEYYAKKMLNNSARTGYMEFVFLNENGMVLRTKDSMAGMTYADWTKETVIAVAPEGAAKAYLVFGADTAKGTYGIDAITVSESAEPATGDVETTDPPADSFGAASLLNGDFEKGFENWNGATHPGATATIVTDGAYSGQSVSFTAQATDTEKAINFRYQDIECAGIKALELSVMSKVSKTTSAGSGYIGFWFYDEKGNLVPENTAFTIPIGTASDWTKDTLIQAVPEGAVTARVEFGNNSGYEGLFYMVDNISVTEYTGPADKIQPATPSKPSGGGGGTKYPAAIVDPSQLNNSFEEIDETGTPVNWRLPGDKSKWSVVETDEAPHGKNVLQFSTDMSGGSVHSARIAIEPGKTYEMKIMAKDIEGAGARLGIYVYTADGTRLDDACKVVTTNGSGMWKMYTAVSAMPENAAAIECEVWYATGSVATVWIDAMVLQESDIVLKPPYVPTPYEYPTVEELLENVTDVYPRIFFTPEEAKEIKLRRFNTLKTKYGWTWNKQYNTLLEAADVAFDVTEVRVSMNTGKSVMMNIWEDVNSQNNRDKYLAASFADDGTKFEEPYTGFGCLIQTQLATMMKNWSLAYTMTGKKMYSEQAIKMAMNVASWEWWIDKYWTDQKNIYADASIAWMMEGMVAVYDMCYNEMTEEQRHTLERSIIEKGIIPLSQQVNPMSTVNGNLMMVGGILSGAAAIINKDNAEEIYPYLKVGLLSMHNALDNYAFSGDTEGHYYTDFGLETFMPGIGQLYRATKMDGIIDHYFLTDILPYWTIMWASNQNATHPNYSDGSIGAYMKTPLGVLQKLTNDPLIDGFLINAGGVGTAFENLVYLKPEPAPEYIDDYAGIIEEFGYGALRTGFANDDMLLTLKANDSQMSHNHYDQNGILFSVGASWLIQDPGAGSYYLQDRSYWLSEGHSTILVDGAGQSIWGTGETKLVFNNNLYSYIMGSAPRAYGEDFDSAMVTKFDRHAIQVNHEDKGYYVIIDDLAADKNRVYTWQMFNGSRGTFSVDGEDVPEETVVKGNMVSMPLGKNVLNLNFIDGEQLEIGDKVHMSGAQKVGLTLTASSAATKAHQFMTVISTDSNSLSSFINFCDILANARSTVPENFTEGEINWSSSMPLGQEIIKPNMIGTTSCVFFRGNKPGDWLEVPFYIEDSGSYEVKLTMGVSDGCCTIKATFDDEHTVENIDCSGLPEDFIDIDFGVLELEAGTHKVRMEVTDKGYDEDYEPGWYLINAGGIDLMRVGVEVPEANDLEVVNVIDNDSAIAGMIEYVDGKFDFLMFNRTAGGITVDKLITDAKQASVLGLVEGAITEGFAATGATAMSYDGKTLFNADKKVDVVASNTGWQVIATEAGTITLSAVAPERDYVITVNGEAVDAKIADGALTIALAAGENHIVVAEEAPVEDPTDPTDPTQGTEATDPTETQPSATEPTTPGEQDGNDATLWIILAVVAVLAIGAAVAIVIIKKRKAAK
ncbi:MAG: DUF4962 domain-containing protein [Ruminococcaceae bacterium]|nr:DUF4962 domain-containing protein [Oscillospiraceae bacterium]